MRARTKIQVEANEIDLLMYNLVYRLEALAKAVKSESIDDISRQMMGSRFSVRLHMHPDDLAETE